MLALAFLVLSVLAVPAEGSAEVALVVRAEVAATVWTDACCSGEVTEADAPHPCAPGESCPGSGGCCACVSCCKRVAHTPADLRPDAWEAASVHAVPPAGLAGTEEVGAVWHPPRD